MAITNYDCGDMSDVVITTTNYKGLITVTTSGGSGEVVLTKANNSVHFLCSGDMSIDAPLNSIHVFISSVSLQGVWSENFLMGLAGVVCGSLLAYVCVKYAV